MQLRQSDFLLTRFAQVAAGPLKWLGDAETDSLRKALAGIAIDRPVFVAGLARSGTTILLNLCAGLSGIATHRYRDFPFLFVPVWWNRFQNRLATVEAPIERPHRDRIAITKESAEAFEEPIWRYFFPFVHRADACHTLTGAQANPRFDEFYVAHLRKILLLRGGRRYVAKGNYNVARIEYLARLFPDARFVIPIRHPSGHVESLVRQHRLFTRYDAADGRVARYLCAAGHYEFGPQRIPINLDEDSPPRIREAWAAGQDDFGYAIQWRSVYMHVRRLIQTDPQLSRRIAIVRYEALCADPANLLRRLFDFCGFAEAAKTLLAALPDISAPTGESREVSPVQRERVWQETGELAEWFGYCKADASVETNAHAW